MRQKQKEGTPSAKLQEAGKHAEPLAEGITERRPRGLLAGMTDEELAGYTEWLMASLEISGRDELTKSDLGLSNTLYKREKKSPGFMKRLMFDRKRREKRYWKSMSDDELVNFTRKLLKEKGLHGRWGVEVTESGLYIELLRRESEDPEILMRLGFERRKPTGTNWISMGDDGIVDYAQKFITKREISRRGELSDTDHRLYQALWSRKLLGRVFESVETSKHKDAVDGVIEALGSFGDKE